MHQTGVRRMQARPAGTMTPPDCGGGGVGTPPSAWLVSSPSSFLPRPEALAPSRLSRMLCCRRPARVCLCPGLPPAPLNTAGRLIILQHPHEARKQLATVPLLELCLADMTVIRCRNYRVCERWLVCGRWLTCARLCGGWSVWRLVCGRLVCGSSECTHAGGHWRPPRA